MEVKINAKARLPLLDLLRYLASLMVAFSHWNLESDLFDTSSTHYLLPLAKVGGTGVAIFFCLSGYVISLTASQKSNAIDFMFARIVRIFPALFICCILVLLIGNHYIHQYANPMKSFLSSIFLLYGYFNIEPLTSVLWTLIIEFKFYLSISILLLIFPRIFQKSKYLLFVMLVYSVFLKVDLPDFLNPIIRFLLFDNNYFYFVIGICIYYLRHFEKTYENLFWLSLLIWHIKMFYHSSLPNNIIVGSIFIIIIAPKIELGFRLSRFCYLLGLASYPIYLLHTQIGMTIINITRKYVTTGNSGILSITICSITFLSIILSLYVEVPIQNILKRTYRNFRM